MLSIDADSHATPGALAPAGTVPAEDGAIILLAGDVDNQNGEDLVTINDSDGAIADGGGGWGGTAMCPFC